MAVSFWSYLFIAACFSVFALFYSRTLLESVSRPFAVRRPGTARPIVVKKKKRKISQNFNDFGKSDVKILIFQRNPS